MLGCQKCVVLGINPVLLVTVSELGQDHYTDRKTGLYIFPALHVMWGGTRNIKSFRCMYDALRNGLLCSYAVSAFFSTDPISNAES